LFSKLYYECHVTVEPLPKERLAPIADRHGFRIAELLMRNGKPHGDDSFMTTRGKEYEDIERRMYAGVGELIESGVKVFRYKIEDTLLDVRIKNP